MAAILLAVAIAPAARAADPAPVIAAERAFAAMGAERGVAPSFLATMSDDAIVFAPDPVNARALYSKRPPGRAPREGGVLLSWWPNWAGIASSGDLGFTTGPVEINGRRNGYYFTVWQKQADGRWRWVYDGGTPSDARKVPGAAAPVLPLSSGAKAALAPAKAMAQVKDAEARLATLAMAGVAAAYDPVLASDTRVQGSSAPPATTAKAVAEELSRRSHEIAFAHLGGGVSAAGDLAWTYGDARWAGGRGHYVRIWQRREVGWRLVFDQILDVPPPTSA